MRISRSSNITLYCKTLLLACASLSIVAGCNSKDGSVEAQMKAFSIQVNEAVLTDDTEFLLKHRGPDMPADFNRRNLEQQFSYMDPGLDAKNSQRELLSSIYGPNVGMSVTEFTTPYAWGEWTMRLQISYPQDGTCCFIDSMTFSRVKNEP